MVFIPRNFTYIGVDEVPLSLSKGGLVVVAAVTRDRKYAQVHSEKVFLKAKHFYDHNLLFPQPQEMEGLTDFHWMRVSNGRFSRQEIEHASIAHVVQSNGFDPQRTVVIVDAFTNRYHSSAELIADYLNHKGFNIPKRNVHCIPQADERVAVVNYADLIALQICALYNQRYRCHFREAVVLDARAHVVPFDAQRVMNPLEECDRKLLEEIITAQK
jgi:hypothetical protein